MNDFIKISGFLLCFVVSGTFVTAQNKVEDKVPSATVLQKANAIEFKVFDYLMSKKFDKIADFIVENIGRNWDDSTKIAERDDYIAKFNVINKRPPQGVFGNLEGFDLIERSFLKGSDRYFRHTYVTYHEGSLLLWEFRYYVLKNGDVTLHFISWSDKNPFEYMTTPDMLLPQ